MLFLLKIDKAPSDFGGGHPDGERQQLRLVLGKISEQLGGNVVTAGIIADPNGAERPPVGDWAYNPSGAPEIEPPTA